VVPYGPRPLQRVLHSALDAHRFVVAVCHRRFGKTVLAVNQLQKKALTCSKPRPRFAYIAPTYRQGKAVAWDYMKHYALPIPEHDVNESELRVDYPNGGQMRIYGADNPDALRGIYLDGVVLDEYGLMAPNVWSEVIRPLLTDRQGWALFIGTPNGKNQFYDISQTAMQEPGWFFAAYKASETHILPASELASARASMTADEYAQEFECSFEASVKGAIYARELQSARESGRLGLVPYEPRLPVDTDWDLGIGDQTAIWFSQSSPRGEVRLIDYYENSGVGLHHYAGVLREFKASKGYSYGDHWAPHDIEVKELGSGQSRWEIATSLGIHFRVAKKLTIEDGINAARMLLPRCWFDSGNCRKGLEALMSYQWDWNERVKEWKPGAPLHNWASHGADAFRTLAVRHFTPTRERQLNEMRRDVDAADGRRKQVQVGRRGGW
jgi:phage terminase large subunit